jgi:hypothetical protein
VIPTTEAQRAKDEMLGADSSSLPWRMPMALSIFLAMLFVLTALGLMFFFGYEGYQSNFTLAKSKEPAEVLRVAFTTGSFFIVPLLVGTLCSFWIAPEKLPWLLLVLLCLGAKIQSDLSQNFLYILIWPANVGLSCFIAIRCIARLRKKV